jgi:DNA gyrase subunit A
MDTKEDDYIEHLRIVSTHDFLLFFTNFGKVYRLKVYELPEGARTAKGRALVNLLPLREGERVQALIPTRDFSEFKYMAFATQQGLVKKTEFKLYNTPIRADGIIAIKLRDKDELVSVRGTDGDDDIIMVSKSGYAARFDESRVRSMGRGTAGVRGMNVSEKDNRVLTMDIARDDTELLVVTENGYGKRSAISDYPVKGRGTKGVKTIQLTDRKGALAGALIVREHQELLFISQSGMVQRTGARGISRLGRSTQGVRVMNMRSGDRVSAVATIADTDEALGAGAGNGASPDQPELPAAGSDAQASGNGADPKGARRSDRKTLRQPAPRIRGKAARKPAARKAAKKTAKKAARKASKKAAPKRKTAKKPAAKRKPTAKKAPARKKASRIKPATAAGRRKASSKKRRR